MGSHVKNSKLWLTKVKRLSVKCYSQDDKLEPLLLQGLFILSAKTQTGQMSQAEQWGISERYATLCRGGRRRIFSVVV